MRWWRPAILGVVAVAALAAFGPRAEAAATADVTVMSRNLYLGADVGEALALLPDMPAAAQLMWEQVAATDFPRRAPLLAAEIAAARPHVIALQEATTWRCVGGLTGTRTVVFDFTRDFLAATADAGVPYVIAAADGRRAFNPGYAIGPYPRLTTVRDPARFRPLFGRDEAACGFEIADALLVRADLADDVLRVGTSEYRDRYAVVPWLFEIDRGYAWADVVVDGVPVRFAATHLESMWDPDAPVVGAAQARQLAGDLAATELPLIVVGDFNADPRDPRPAGAPNSGGQPEAGAACRPQDAAPVGATADATCNAYWAMIGAGYVDAGPDALDPANLTWGSSGLLAGPDLDRLGPALALGNRFGYTDRLDYVFVRNGVDVVGAALVGDAWPTVDGTWGCGDPAQIANTEAASAVLAAESGIDPIVGRGACLPTDHVGIVARLRVVAPDVAVVARAADTAPPATGPGLSKRTIAVAGIAYVAVTLVALIVIAVWLVVRLVRRLARSATG